MHENVLNVHPADMHSRISTHTHTHTHRWENPGTMVQQARGNVFVVDIRSSKDENETGSLNCLAHTHSRTTSEISNDRFRLSMPFSEMTPFEDN